MGGAGISNAASPQQNLYILQGKTFYSTYNAQVGAGYKLLRNPAAGKTFYLMGVGMASTSTENATRPAIFDDRMKLLLEGYHDITATYKTTSSLNLFAIFPIPIPITNSTNGIEIIGAPNTTTRGWIMGWEE